MNIVAVDWPSHTHTRWTMSTLLKANRRIEQLPFDFQILDSSHWKVDCSRQQTFKVHRCTETIFLRFRHNLTNQKIGVKNDSFLIKDYPLMPLYQNQVDRCLDFLSRFYSFRDFCLIAARLLPHSQIPLHKDRGEYFKKSHRIHIPIKTTKDSIFLIEDNQFHMELRWAYEIDNVNCRHGVANGSELPRDHLIFDLFD